MKYKYLYLQYCVKRLSKKMLRPTGVVSVYLLNNNKKTI